MINKKNINLFTIINLCFRLFILFLIFFVWLRYITKELAISLVLSICLAILSDFILNKIFQFFKKNRNLTNKEKERIDEYSLYFLFNDDEDNINFFYSLAKKKHDVIKGIRYLTIINNDSIVLLFPFFTFRKFSCDDLIYVYNQTKFDKPTKLVICTNEVEPAALKLASKLTQTNIVILDKTEIFHKLLTEYDYYPEKKVELKENIKISFKELIAFSLNKKRTKGYFISSIILLFSSFIVNNNIYYIIMSSILLILAFVSLVNPRFNKVTKGDIFET